MIDEHNTDLACEARRPLHFLNDCRRCIDRDECGLRINAMTNTTEVRQIGAIRTVIAQLLSYQSFSCYFMRRSPVIVSSCDLYCSLAIGSGSLVFLHLYPIWYVVIERHNFSCQLEADVLICHSIQFQTHFAIKKKIGSASASLIFRTGWLAVCTLKLGSCLCDWLYKLLYVGESNVIKNRNNTTWSSSTSY